MRFDPWRQFVVATQKVPRVRSWVARSVPTREMEVDGARLALCPSDNRSEMMTWLMGTPPESTSIARLVDEVRAEACLFVDVGANAGLYSVLVGKETTVSSRIISVEPNPTMVARLRHNLHLNGLSGKATILEAALGAEEGEATLSIHPRNLGMSSLNAVDGAVRQITVPTRPLADVIAENALGRRVIVKIDIEGYEDTVLMPFFSGDPAQFPSVLLLETQYASGWRGDLLGSIARAGYRAVFEGEGNTLFIRGAAAA